MSNNAILAAFRRMGRQRNGLREQWRQAFLTCLDMEEVIAMANTNTQDAARYSGDGS